MTQAILKCLPLLADVLGRAYGVTVEIGGNEAFTTGKVIRLPSLPATSDPTFLGLVRGYLDHEAAHVRHTDFEAMKKAGVTPLEKHVWNILEDWRVENELAAIFPGCRQNFRWLIRHIFQKPSDQSRPSVYAVLDWLLLTVRSWSVPELVSQCQEEGDQLDRLWPGLRPRLETILATMRGNCPDSLACLDYARQVITCLAEAAQNSEAKKPKRKRTPPPEPGDGTSISSKTAGSQEGGSQNPPSAVLASPTDLRTLIDAKVSDLPEDFGQILKRAMGDGVMNSNRCAVATVGTKPLFPLSTDDLDAIQQVTAGLRARLHGTLQATRLVRQTPSRKGRIDPRHIHGITIGEAKVFLTHGHKPAINTAVHILLDASASMRKRMGLASQCCHAVAQAMDRIGISVGITAFPGNQPHSVVPLLLHGDRIHTNLVVEAGGQTPMGESLWWVLQRLVSLREERKIVLIITDGAPDNFTIVKEAIRTGDALGIEIFGLGIDAPQISSILPKTSRNIDALPKLPAVLFGMLQEALLFQRRAA